MSCEHGWTNRSALGESVDKTGTIRRMAEASFSPDKRHDVFGGQGFDMPGKV